MGNEFNEISDRSGPGEAWRMYRRRLMENQGVLCQVIPPRDMMDMCMKIDESVRQKADSDGMTPLEETRNFLGGKVQ
jgi:hypothetical protein